jgi:hypothetical protein
VDGCDGVSAFVDGRHGSRQRVGRLASLRSWSRSGEKEERNKIYAAGKKKKGPSEARRCQRLGLPHPR